MSAGETPQGDAALPANRNEFCRSQLQETTRMPMATQLANLALLDPEQDLPPSAEAVRPLCFFLQSFCNNAGCGTCAAG